MSKEILMILEREFPPDVRVEKEIGVLIKNGYRVHILTYTKKNALALEESGNLTTHRKPITKFIYKSSVACLLFPTYFNYWNKYISEITAKHSFDTIHIHDLPLAKIGVKWSKKLKIPVLLDLHENWPAMLQEATHTNTFFGKLLSWNWQWEAYERKMVDAVDAVVTVVEEMKCRVASYSANQEKFHVYQNVPEIKSEYKLYSYTPPTNTLSLVYLGGVNVNRGIQTVIKAMSLLSKDFPVKFTVIGAGSYLDELKVYAEKLNLHEKVTFTGYMQQDRALDKVKEHHLAIVPHYRSIQTDNSSPNKLFQYMMMGIPVISSNCTSLVRVLEKHRCGVHYQDSSAEDLAEKLQALWKTPSQLSDYSKNAHTAVMTELNADHENANLLATYKWLKV